MKIVTSYNLMPIPLRCFDWCAVDDETYDGEGSPIGYGETEEKAIEALLEQIDMKG